MKKIYFMIVIICFLMCIYYFNKDNKVYILTLSDSSFLNSYNVNDDIVDFFSKKKLLERNVVYKFKKDYRITDLINDINNNIEFKFKNKNYHIDNTLIKADIILLFIGFNDLTNYNNNLNYIDEILDDYGRLLRLIRRYSKKRILLFYYFYLEDNNSKIYIKRKISDISLRYNIDLFDISSINNNYNLNNKVKNFLDKLY